MEGRERRREVGKGGGEGRWVRGERSGEGEGICCVWTTYRGDH